jgi:hypothetical protein
MKITVFFLGLLLALTLQASPKTPSRGEIGWRMAKVKVHHGYFQAPRLTRYRNPKVMKSVNRRIDASFRDLGCEPEPGQEEGSLEIKSSVKLAARDIFSVYVMGSYFCGGAYPTNEDFRSATFDLRTGKSVEFEGLFRDYGRDKRAILSTIFAEQVAKAVKHPEPSDVPDEKRSCADEPGLYALEALEESTYTFNFSPRGLEVQPEWSHVVQACEIRVTVPYGKLKPYAASRGLLERMLD